MSFSFRSVSFDPSIGVQYVLDSISEDADKPIALYVKHTGHGNAAYRNALSKIPDALRGQARMEAIADVFADHAIERWENVTVAGESVAYTRDLGREFLRALIAPPPEGRPDVFDRLYAFAANPENYRGKIASAAPLGKG
jgi:hypothetical protein